jgi:hypothetical protein
MALRVSLVNLQKLTLWAWLAPASMRMLAPAENTRGLPERRITALASGCSKRKRCIASWKLDVDAEVIGIELQLIALEQPGGFVDIQDQFGHRPAGHQPPVPIARGLGGKIDPCGRVLRHAGSFWPAL